MTMLADQAAVAAANDVSTHAVQVSRKDHVFLAAGSAAPIADLLPLDAVIGVGFGIATLTRDGYLVYEEHGGDPAGPITVAQAEELAQKFPEHDWCIHLIALLEDRHYRRVGKDCWKLYKRGYGLS
jgi:hypothetical protein